jgi:hypothetical protein
MNSIKKHQLFRQCRLCYNHMGGVLATSLFSSLLHQECVCFLEKSHFDNKHERLPLFITSKGYSLFQSIGISLPFNTHAYACLDGTEKLPHLGGKCGELFLTFLLEHKIINKTDKKRTLEYGTNGSQFLEGIFSNYADEN